MGKLTAYDINSSTQVARTHSGVSDSENNGKLAFLQVGIISGRERSNHTPTNIQTHDIKWNLLIVLS